MKKIIPITMLTAIMFTACPSNIQSGYYCIYTINGVVTKSDKKTPIENILIEVRQHLMTDKNASIVINFSSGDENFITSSVYTHKSEYERQETACNSGNKFSSGDENLSANETPADDANQDNSTDIKNPSDASDDKNSSPDENPILADCRTAADGSFSLTFKAYLADGDQSSDTDEAFYLYLSDNSNIIPSGTYEEVSFSEGAEESSGNPYGSYHSKSKIKRYDITLSY